jgi:hypothetical protein
MNRRDLLKLLGGGAVLSMIDPASVLARSQPDDFFVFIHAAGGWDITLWADPRNERRGIVHPASTATIETGGLTHWRNAPLDGDVRTFEIVTPKGSSLRLGPALGGLVDLHDRLTIINGIAMNTVSHEDGVTFSTTGRHRTGGAIPESSVDVLIANELGTTQRIPAISVQFPSAFIGDRLDRRVVPLRVETIDAVTRPFVRSSEYLGTKDRAEITALLVEEARVLGDASTHPAVYEQLASQQRAVGPLIAGEFTEAFQPAQLRKAYPQFDHAGRYHGPQALSAAFAVEAFRRNLARCMSFALGGLDTHDASYRRHGNVLQELFDVIASLVKVLDTVPHPTLSSTKLGERTHILVVSEFCRTPQINPNGGRDHYPNNSALVISPRFKRGTFGSTDPEQLLPRDLPELGTQKRPIAPPDLIATYLAAFGIDHRRYMRDGDVIRGLLA